MANGRKLNEVTNVSTLASSDRIVTVRTSDGKTVQISLTDFMNTLIGGLGTAATHDVTTSATDTTSGRVLKVGDLGTGINKTASISDVDDYRTLYPYTGVANNMTQPNALNSLGINYIAQYFSRADIVTQLAIPYRVQDKFAWRARYNNNWSDWQEILHTGNLDSLLGTAATHDVTTSATDTTEGRLLKVRDFGIGSHILLDSSHDLNNVTTPGFYRHTQGSAPSNAPKTGAGYLQVWLEGNDYAMQIWYDRQNGDEYHRVKRAGTWQSWREFYHTGNTTVDGNGFIKAASPIVKLFNDHIEHEGFEQETPTFQKVDTGVYEIKGTSGLAKRGWYIETPTDRNNDAYFNTEWEQTPYEIPIDENGQLTEPQNVTLLIKTFERVWDAGAGKFTNGAPVDIDVAAGPDRFIALRFTGVKPAEEEPEGEGGEE